MKIENKNWNDIVEALRNHSSDIDLDTQWAVLEQNLHQKKKRRMLFFLFSALVVFSATLVIFKYPRHSKVDAPEFGENAFAINNFVNKSKGCVGENDSSIAIISNDNNFENKIELKESVVKIEENDMRFDKLILAETSIEIKHSEAKAYIGSNESDYKNGLNIGPSVRTEEISLTALPPLSTFLEVRSPELREIEFPIKAQMKQNTIWLDFTISTGLHKNTFKALNNQSESTIKHDIKELENFSMKGRLGKALNKNIYITSGFQFQRYNDLLSRTIEQNVSNTMEDQLVETYTNSNGEVFERYADVTVLTTSIVKQKRFNQHHILNLDLGLGYTVDILGKDRLQVELGIGKCVWLHQKGYIQNNQDQLVNMSDVSTGIPTFNYHTSIHYNWSLGSNYFLLLGYSFNTFNYRYQALYDVQVKNNSIDFTIRKLLN